MTVRFAKFFLTTTILLLVVMTAPILSAVLLQENFDSYHSDSFPAAGGWVLRFNGFGSEFQLIDSDAWSSPASLNLEGACNWASEAYRILPVVAPIMRLSTMVRLDLLEDQCLPYQDALIGFQNSEQYATTYYALGIVNGVAGDNVPVAFAEWHKVIVEINTVAKTYSTWLDSRSVQIDVSYLGSPNPDAIVLTSHNGRHTRTHYDDVVVEGIEISGTSVVWDDDQDNSLPAGVSLSQNQPNPFNPSTQIRLSLRQTLEVRLIICNVLGERIATLAEGTLAPGTHSVTWDGYNGYGQSVASGVYFCRLEAGEWKTTRKLLLLK